MDVNYSPGCFAFDELPGHQDAATAVGRALQINDFITQPAGNNLFLRPNRGTGGVQPLHVEGVVNRPGTRIRLN